MSGYKRKNNMKPVLIPGAKYISSLDEDREKEQKSSRHLWMLSKELNECTSSCLLFYQRTSCISSTNISLWLLLLFFVVYALSDPIMYSMLFPSLSFVREVISFELCFKMRFHICIIHSTVIVIRIYPSNKCTKKLSLF
jgi:hypothetical protein